MCRRCRRARRCETQRAARRSKTEARRRATRRSGLRFDDQSSISSVLLLIEANETHQQAMCQADARVQRDVDQPVCETSFRRRCNTSPHALARAHPTLSVVRRPSANARRSTGNEQRVAASCDRWRAERSAHCPRASPAAAVAPKRFVAVRRESERRGNACETSISTTNAMRGPWRTVAVKSPLIELDIRANPNVGRVSRRAQEATLALAFFV